MHGTTPVSSDVYYSGTYWNARAEVVAYMNELATGDAATHWWQDLLAWRGRPFKRALAINCGNGWVERDLIGQGVVESAIGIDISAELLAEARGEAARHGMPIDYLQVDINTFDFGLDQPGVGMSALDGVDLVINFAAAHHIAHIDRVFRHIARLLGPEGAFVSYDYVGSHRNLYPTAHWEAIWQANESLPLEFRRALHYAHLPAILAGDPTEAIHSELIVSTMRRYFDLPVERYLGGAVAYEVLSFNPPFHDPARHTGALVEQILAADRAYRDRDPAANSLFAYLIAVPRPTPDAGQLAEWSRLEHQRETAVGAAGGRYYPPTMVEALYDRIYALETESAQRAEALRRLQAISPWRLVARRAPGAALLARWARRWRT